MGKYTFYLCLFLISQSVFGQVDTTKSYPVKPFKNDPFVFGIPNKSLNPFGNNENKNGIKIEDFQLAKNSNVLDSLKNVSRMHEIGLYGDLAAASKSPNKVKVLTIVTNNEAELNHFFETISDYQNIEVVMLETDLPFSIPQSIKECKKMREIIIRAPNMGELPINITELKNLEIFQIIDSPKITKLPADFQKLSNLTTLKINGSIETIDSTIFQLTALIDLDLSGNPIKNIPNQFFKLKYLKRLNLSHTEIHILPSSFYELSTLEECDLSNTSINSISPAVQLLSSLRQINLFKTKIDILPIEFAKCKMLYLIKIDPPTTPQLRVVIKKIVRKSGGHINFQHTEIRVVKNGINIVDNGVYRYDDSQSRAESQWLWNVQQHQHYVNDVHNNATYNPWGR